MDNLLHNQLVELKNKTTRTLISLCPVTGIISEIEVSTSIVLEQRNKLSSYPEILNLISTNEIKNLKGNELAGISLAILKKKNLIVSKLSSSENNLLLSRVDKTILLDFIVFLVGLTKNQLGDMPKISLASQLLVDSTESKKFLLDNVIVDYIKINKVELPEGFCFNTNTRIEPKKVKTAISAEIKAEIKDLVAEVKATNLIPAKISKLLELATSGNNLLSLLNPEGIGSKIIASLNSVDSTKAKELASKLSNIAKNLTLQDKAAQVFIKDLENVSDSSISKPRKTFAEIMAEKLAQAQANCAKHTGQGMINLADSNNSNNSKLGANDEF